MAYVVIFLNVIYCGGYSGEVPPLLIPNREVKLTSADGTAPPGGRVGSCRFSGGPMMKVVGPLFLYKSVAALLFLLLNSAVGSGVVLPACFCIVLRPFRHSSAPVSALFCRPFQIDIV